MVITRKLNQVRNSFYVYLPRDWCNKFKLTKKSEVKIIQTQEGILNIIPPSITEQKIKPITLNLDINYIENIINLLVGAYIVGTGELELHFPDGLDMTTRGEISKWINRLSGFEILDEHSNSFVISDTSEKQVITPILKRQFQTTKYMLNGMVSMLETGNTDDHIRILDRDEDVDRNRYFVERLCHLVLRDPAYARRINLLPQDALSFSLAAKHVERIADHICGAIEEIVKAKNISPKLTHLASDISKVYNDTASVFFSIDKKYSTENSDLAQDTSEALNLLQEAMSIVKSLSKLESSRKEKTAPEILLTLHLERISSYCADIIEIGINRIIESRL